MNTPPRTRSPPRQHLPKRQPRGKPEKLSPLRNNTPSYMHAQLTFNDSVVPKTRCEVGKSREKQGLCPICGLVTTHRKKLLRLEPLNREGEVLEGFCLRCYTMDFVLSQPGVLDRMEKRRKKDEKKSRHKRDVKSMGNLIPRNQSDESTHSTARPSESWGADRYNNMLSDSDIEPMADQFRRATRDLPGTRDLSGTGDLDATNSSNRYNTSLSVSDLKPMASQFHRSMPDLPIAPGEPSENSSEMQSLSCLDLVDLYEEGREDLLEVIDAITNAMEKYITSAEMQSTGCRAFHRLSVKRQRSAIEEPEINHDNCAKMEVEGAIHSVINAMNNHHNSEQVQKEGMRFIRNCLRATGSSKGIVLSRNGIEVIVRAMWNLETCSIAQEDGCIILWSLAVSDPEAQYSVVFNNGIGAILNGMSKHLSIEKVQYNACGALQTLSSSNSEIKENILENGAYDAIFNSMNEHKYSKSVAEAASTAVKNLLKLALENSSYANACKMSDRHVQIIVKVMKSNAGEAHIQKKLCQLLEKGAQSHLNIEALRRNESLRYTLQEAAANHPAECLDSVVTIVSIIET